MKETKQRSFFKTISWRGIAIINSYLVLLMMWTESPLYNSLIMNLFGLILYYFHERLWNLVKRK